MKHFIICSEERYGYAPLNEGGIAQDSLTFFKEDEYKEYIEKFQEMGTDVKAFEIIDVEC